MARPARSKKKAVPADEKPKRKPRWFAEGRRFAEVLTERKIGHTTFARRIEVQYYNVWRWTKGYDFTPENQAVAARGLNLPDDAFAVPNEAKLREIATAAVLEQFMQTKPELAESLTERDWKVLTSIRFHDRELRPTVAFYEAVALALKGAIRVDEILDVAATNAELDRTLATKPPLRRR